MTNFPFLGCCVLYFWGVSFFILAPISPKHHPVFPDFRVHLRVDGEIIDARSGILACTRRIRRLAQFRALICVLRLRDGPALVDAFDECRRLLLVSRRILEMSENAVAGNNNHPRGTQPGTHNGYSCHRYSSFINVRPEARGGDIPVAADRLTISV